MNQHAEVTFETEETIVLRQGARAEKRFCSKCNDLALMLTPQAAAAMSGMTEREIFRLIEVGKIHFTEAEPIRVCLKSVGDLLNEITPNDETPSLLGGTEQK